MKIAEVNSTNFELLEELFGSKGACGGCWCMHFRLPNKEWQAGKQNNENKRKLKQLVDEKKSIGVVAVKNEKAIAWAALSPRLEFIKLARSRIHKPIDEKMVWSIPCLFVRKEFRNQGLLIPFLKEILAFAKTKNINIVEAYPVKTSQKLPAPFMWVGPFQAFEKIGFKIVSHVSKNRPMMRYYLD